MDGYGHADYAASLAEFGKPRALHRAGGWVLERLIDGFPYHDAMGCYPLFVCDDWSKLNADLEELSDCLVCLSLVADPFGGYDLASLRQIFRDVFTPFKQHFVVDLSRALESFVHPHHRRNGRKALREMRVEKCQNPRDFLEDWTTLYATLIDRHDIRGMSAFSRASFARQFTVPGIVMFRAVRDKATVGMVLWYRQGNRAYYHLGAYSALGYELRASFALFNHSLEYFARQGVAWLNLGAGAGAGPGAESGLTRFKQGWSTGTRTAYFCGRVFQREKYEQILQAKSINSSEYFPAYRLGEFG